jgi:hypothetical protein
MWRPRPTPPVFNSFVSSRNPKSLNSLLKSSSFIPTPESYTVTSIIPFGEFLKRSLKSSLYVRSSSYWMNLHFILIFPPLRQNLIAFEKRFKSTCWILFWSEQIKKLFELSWTICLSLFFSKFINSISTVIFSYSILYY